MHAIFIPYGIKDWIDDFFRDMQAQKFQLPIHSPDGKETKVIWMQGSLRLLPFGVVEYVFPKEYMDLVLTTLRFQPSINPNTKGKRHNYNYISPFKLNILKRALKAQNIPEFKTDNSLIWTMDNVSIIPIGIREDGEIIEPPNAIYPGWTHEAI